MRFWFNLLYLCVGLWFLGEWFLGRVAPRTRKNPFLYFGIGVICSGIADLLPPSAARLSSWLEIVATLALLVAAVFFFAFAKPPHSQALGNGHDGRVALSPWRLPSPSCRAAPRSC